MDIRKRVALVAAFTAMISSPVVLSGQEAERTMEAANAINALGGDLLTRGTNAGDNALLPFLFAIQHRASGACLFLGRVVDPR